ncbi:MAG: protein phosphatase CheZ, partial [Xanthomonadales bacterium]|nr:protein phosphatase CheZ [Xanthomonadales bacterium]
MSGDSADLEALFDSIAGAAAPAPAASPASISAPVAPVPAASAGGDCDELQALFDSVSATAGVASAADAGSDAGDWPTQEKVFQRVGHMARQLHDTLRELGYDKMLSQTMEALPDAKDRLTYIASLTEQAACKVLNATDVANPLVESLETDAAALAQRWDRLFANQMGVDDFKALAADTRSFLKGQLPDRTAATKAQLMEIMMAQDFQDLTGQVIKKVVSVAQDIESQLMNALIEVMPGERRTESVNSLLNGPVVNAEGRTDVVVDQQQVDDL